MLVMQYTNACKPRTVYDNHFTTNVFNGGTIDSGTWWKHEQGSTFADYVTNPSERWYYSQSCNYVTEIQFERLNFSPNWYNDANFGLFALTCHPGFFVGFKVLDANDTGPNAPWVHYNYTSLADFSSNTWRFEYNADRTWELFRNDISIGSGTVGAHYYATGTMINPMHSLAHNGSHRIDYYNHRTVA